MPHTLKTRTAARHAGFTLIELMIALLLGLLVIAAVTSVFMATQRGFRSNRALADVQDNSRIAFELMARDIRDAGLTGCNSVNGRIGNLLKNQGAAWWAHWGNAIHGYDDASKDPALAGKNPLATSSSLELISAAAQPAVTQTLYDGSATQLVLVPNSRSFAAGDIAVICSPGQAAIFQIDQYDATNRKISFASDVGNPGNSSTNLGYDPSKNCNLNGSPEINCFPGNSLVSTLDAVDWYLGTNPQGGTSLYRLSLVNTAGVPTPTTLEMVRDVEDLAISYLGKAATSGSAATGAGSPAASVSDWTGVDAVQVSLKLSARPAPAVTTGVDRPLSREYSFTVNLRNRTE